MARVGRVVFGLGWCMSWQSPKSIEWNWFIRLLRQGHKLLFNLFRLPCDSAVDVFKNNWLYNNISPLVRVSEWVRE